MVRHRASQMQRPQQPLAVAEKTPAASDDATRPAGATRQEGRLDAVKAPDGTAHWSDLYQQVSASYHAIEDMRLRLLSFLPLTSGAGIFFLLATPGATLSTASAIHDFLTPIGSVGACITVGLFAYELRATQNSIALTTAGKQLERDIGMEGPFTALPRSFAYIINYLFAAVLIYSAVLAGWIYVAISPWVSACIGMWIATCAYGVPVVVAVLVQFIFKGRLLNQWSRRVPMYTIPGLNQWLDQQEAPSVRPEQSKPLSDRLTSKLNNAKDGATVLFTSDEVNRLAARFDVSRDDLLAGATLRRPRR